MIKNDALVYSKAFGTADGPNNIPASTETVYHWWSMTKIPTAIAIMQLYEQGKLDLGDPVIDYLPFFNVEYPSPESPAITVRHLLTHTSGLPDTIPAMIGWVHYEDAIYNQTDLLKQHLPDYSTLKFEPGEKSAYTNLGYLVLGALIEEITGQSYESYIKENILTPLGMESTDFLYAPKMGTVEAIGSHPLLSIYTPMLPSLLDMDDFVKQKAGHIYWTNRVYIDVTPSTGLIGSTTDAAKLLIAYLNTHPVLSEESKALMLPTGEAPGERALGWAQFALGERPYLQHSGGGPGFATVMRLYPEENLGIVIMANGTNLDRDKLVDLLASLDWEH